MIRSKLPDATIGLFFHATMPSSEILRCLTTRNDILKGMLGSTLVGFQVIKIFKNSILIIIIIIIFHLNVMFF